MFVNSSSSSNASLLHPTFSSNNYNIPLAVYCLTTRRSAGIFASFSVTYILFLLPLCIFIIYHGLQQWRLNGSTSSAATMSHSDSFTYNMVTMEMIGVFGCVLVICGVFSDQINLTIVGTCLFTFTWYGQMFFHVLTCVERYLAVVHPITYLSLKKERGIRIRNISITCVWLLSAVAASLLMVNDIYSSMAFCTLVLSLIVISFCSVSVLCVLIRPGPGEQGGARKRVDQSKLRAFYTIMVILGVLVLRFTWNLAWTVIHLLGRSIECDTMIYGIWFNIPTALVLPLLFLHRVGKLACCSLRSLH